MKIPVLVRACGIAIVTAVLLLAQYPDAPLKLDIAAMRNVVKSGTRVQIRVVLTNASGRTILLRETSPELDYDVAVLGSDGASPSDTERGDRVKDKNRRLSFFISNAKRAAIGPNGMIVEPGGIDVDNLYDMTRPDRYTIQVQRKLPEDLGGGLIKSNTITVTVTQ